MDKFDLDDSTMEFRPKGPYYIAAEVDARMIERHFYENMADRCEKAEARIAELEGLLRRVIDWEPALPVEASLADEIGKALGL